MIRCPLLKSFFVRIPVSTQAGLRHPDDAEENWRQQPTYVRYVITLLFHIDEYSWNTSECSANGPLQICNFLLEAGKSTTPTTPKSIYEQDGKAKAACPQTALSEVGWENKTANRGSGRRGRASVPERFIIFSSTLFWFSEKALVLKSSGKRFRMKWKNRAGSAAMVETIESFVFFFLYFFLCFKDDEKKVRRAGKLFRRWRAPSNRSPPALESCLVVLSQPHRSSSSLSFQLCNNFHEKCLLRT